MTGLISLSGQCILVLEDDYFLARDAARVVQEAGAEVGGPYPTEDGARDALEETRMTAAVIDINLGAGPSFGFAETLVARGIPFIFVTGYDETVIPPRYDRVPRLLKPVEPQRMLHALADVLGRDA